MRLLKIILLVSIIACVIFISNLLILQVLGIDILTETQKSFNLITGYFYKPVEVEVKNIDYKIQETEEVTDLEKETENELHSKKLEQINVSNITQQTNTTEKKQNQSFKIDITGDGDLREFKDCQEALDFVRMLYNADLKRYQQQEQDVDTKEERVDRYEKLLSSTNDPDKKAEYQEYLDTAKAELKIAKEKLERAENSLESSQDNLERVQKKCLYMS